MNKILLSVLALLALAGSGTAQSLPSYVPANGLVGWWPFNGNANDESGNNNNGTVNGATLTADRFGNAGKAYGFDGASIISVNSNTNLCLQNKFTISLWVLRDNSNSMGFISKGRDNQGGISYHISGNGSSLGVGINNDPGGCSTCNIGSGGPTSNFNNWNHYLGIWDGVRLKFFENNNLVSDADGTLGNGNTLFNFNSPLIFGQYNPQTLLSGSLDDIAIYNRALTQQEITALYQGGNTTANCPTFPASLTQGLVGYWPFCGNALDESGNDNHGTVNGASLTTDRFGNAGSAYGFDGNSDKIEGTIVNSINSTQASGLTISGWMWLDSNSLQLPRTLAYLRDGTTGAGYTLIYDQVLGRIKGMAGLANQTPSMEVVSNNPPQVENWVFVSMTCDLISNTTKFFINSILQESTSEPLPTSNLNEYGFGKQTLAWDHLGYLDDIAIWNRALTQQEITQLYNQGICQTSITVTDTLLIHTGITAYNPVAYGNTLKVWPNPGNTAITLDAGNLSSMQGWKIRISNSLGQEVYPATPINQQQQVLSMSTWGGNGLYLLHLINPQGHITEVKKIVLAP